MNNVNVCERSEGMTNVPSVGQLVYVSSVLVAWVMTPIAYSKCLKIVKIEPVEDSKVLPVHADEYGDLLQWHVRAVCTDGGSFEWEFWTIEGRTGMVPVTNDG